jgi:hypothetical protein
MQICVFVFIVYAIGFVCAHLLLYADKGSVFKKTLVLILQLSVIFILINTGKYLQFLIEKLFNNIKKK